MNCFIWWVSYGHILVTDIAEIKSVFEFMCLFLIYVMWWMHERKVNVELY